MATCEEELSGDTREYRLPLTEADVRDTLGSVATLDTLTESQIYEVERDMLLRDLPHTD